jgi:hypothetical protein
LVRAGNTGRGVGGLRERAYGAHVHCWFVQASFAVSGVYFAALVV